MIRLLKELWRRLLYDADYAAARIRTVVMSICTVIAGLSSSGHLSKYLDERWAILVVAIGGTLAASISQGERNPRQDNPKD